MWIRLVNAALGIWLMAAPAVLGYGAPAATNDRIVGPAVATFGIVAMAGATRPARWGNTVFGAWLLVAPWLLGYATWTTRLNDVLVGAVVIAVSLVRGRVDDTFAGGWSSLWSCRELHDPEGAARESRRG